MKRFVALAVLALAAFPAATQSLSVESSFGAAFSPSLPFSLPLRLALAFEPADFARLSASFSPLFVSAGDFLPATTDLRLGLGAEAFLPSVPWLGLGARAVLSGDAAWGTSRAFVALFAIADLGPAFRCELGWLWMAEGAGAPGSVPWIEPATAASNLAWAFDFRLAAFGSHSLSARVGNFGEERAGTLASPEIAIAWRWSDDPALPAGLEVFAMMRTGIMGVSGLSLAWGGLEIAAGVVYAF